MAHSTGARARREFLAGVAATKVSPTSAAIVAAAESVQSAWGAYSQALRRYRGNAAWSSANDSSGEEPRSEDEEYYEPDDARAAQQADEQHNALYVAFMRAILKTRAAEAVLAEESAGRALDEAVSAAAVCVADSIGAVRRIRGTAKLDCLTAGASEVSALDARRRADVVALAAAAGTFATVSGAASAAVDAVTAAAAALEAARRAAREAAARAAAEACELLASRDLIEDRAI